VEEAALVYVPFVSFPNQNRALICIVLISLLYQCTGHGSCQPSFGRPRRRV
jgi:hypothetical protein